MSLPLPDFSTCRIVVAGDIMLDRYWTGDTQRISPEAPVPVVRIHAVEDRAGGAGNVALNIAALGGQAVVLGVVGDDEAGATVHRLLAQTPGIEVDFHQQTDIHTITKLRVLSRHQQLLRLDFEEPERMVGDAVPGLLAQALERADVVILSDYDKGALSESAALIAAARDAGKPVLVDPKSPDFSRYRGASIATPNLAEFCAVVGHVVTDGELAERGARLMADHALGALLVTRGEHGMTLLRPDLQPVHIPAQAREVFDVTGAGDTVIGTLGLALAAGMELEGAARLANLAAGIVVGRLGAATVTPAALRRAQRLEQGERKVVDETALLQLVADARAHGETLVMTNGCFDLLHAGHVAYLQAAAQLGHRLVVAVNDDDSVRRLKGEPRPINTLDERMAVLAALGCVDWVVPFSEDTPQRLICEVRPEVLVKGADYQGKPVAGADCAGRLELIPLVPGCSTSEILRRGDNNDGH